MMLFLRTWILNIATVIIFISFLEILLPNTDIKKYIKMIIGLLVMLVIVNPILELVNGKVNLEKEIFITTSAIDKKNLMINAEKFEKELNNSFITLYKEKIENSIKQWIEYNNSVRVVRVHAEIEENIHDPRFGSIKKVNIILSRIKNKNFNEKGINTIPPIKIKKAEEKVTTTIAQDEDANFTAKIQTYISNLYDLDKDFIHISIYKN